MSGNIPGMPMSDFRASERVAHLTSLVKDMQSVYSELVSEGRYDNSEMFNNPMRRLRLNDISLRLRRIMDMDVAIEARIQKEEERYEREVQNASREAKGG